MQEEKNISQQQGQNQTIPNNQVIANDNTQAAVSQDSQTGTQNIAPSPKGSKFKTFGVIFIFILLFVLVLFLPQISSYMDSRKHKEPVIQTKPKEEIYQTRSCGIKKETEQVTNVIKLDFSYQNNSLKKEQLTNVVTIPKANKETQILHEMQLACQKFKAEIEKNSGINQTCMLKDNTYTIVQKIDYSKLQDITVQKNIGELEGFYPEFSLNQDRKVIEKELTDIGYICKNKN